jgi:hypothetical protein
MDFWQSLDRVITPRSTPTLRSTPAPYAANGMAYDAANRPMAGRRTPTLRSTPAPLTDSGGTYDATQGCISAPTTLGYNGRGLPYGTATGSAAPTAASSMGIVATVPLSVHDAQRSSLGDSARLADAYSAHGVQQADLQPQVMHQTTHAKSPQRTILIASDADAGTRCCNCEMCK